MRWAITVEGDYVTVVDADSAREALALYKEDSGPTLPRGRTEAVCLAGAYEMGDDEELPFLQERHRPCKS